MGEDVVAAHPLPSTLFLRSSPRDLPTVCSPGRSSRVPTTTSRWSVAPERVESENENVDLFERRDDSRPSPSSSSPSLDPPGVDRGVSPPLPGLPSSSPSCVRASPSGVCSVRGEGIGGALYPAGL